MIERYVDKHFPFSFLARYLRGEAAMSPGEGLEVLELCAKLFDHMHRRASRLQAQLDVCEETAERAMNDVSKFEEENEELRKHLPEGIDIPRSARDRIVRETLEWKFP